MHNPENERIKRAYCIYLKEARRLGEHSIDGAAAALAKFEAYTKHRDFKRFHIQQAIGFKTRLSEEISTRTGERLSRGTVFSTLNALRGFFHWLSTQPGYRSHLSSADAEYFALSDKEARIAKAIAERPVPNIEQIRHVLQTMPAVTDIELRNRAVVAFTLLTGARDGAIASLKLKHVDVAEGKLVQDAREVRTKFAKTFTTWFFPVGDDVRQIVVDWVTYPHGEAVRPGRSAISGNGCRAGSVSPVPDGGPLARALVQRHADQIDLQGGVHQRRSGLRQSTLLSQNTRPAWRAPMPNPGGIQGLEPEPWTRAGADDLF
jgi:site-specific recombinase XerD